jgi:hypothetical protein
MDFLTAFAYVGILLLILLNALLVSRLGITIDDEDEL